MNRWLSFLRGGIVGVLLAVALDDAFTVPFFIYLVGVTAVLVLTDEIAANNSAERDRKLAEKIRGALLGVRRG